MIYAFPKPDEPIRQGDIFVGLPRPDFSLDGIPILADQNQAEQVPWRQIADSGKTVTALIGLTPVTAIVASQNCDAARAPAVTLCEIREFRDVEKKSKDTTSPKKFAGIITQHSRLNQKWFYLPPDSQIGWESKMAVDFLVTLRIRRGDLESLRDLRRGRLTDIPEAHFRERLSQFFRRYPYDEWYPLDKQEFGAYQKDYPEAKPFPWQTDT